jgi:predicted RNA binding protein YcfA (HicA-like mRNA interferase family)
VRLARDLSGRDLIAALGRIGYVATRQTGSHVRLTSAQPPQHHVTVPLHDPLRIGTLAAIVAAVAQARQVSRDELLRQLFGS